MAWPILLSAVADFTAGPPNLPGVNQVALDPTVDVKAFATGQGRQYELDQAEAGTLTMTIDDPNEALSPLNSGSPWNAGSNSLLPYRGVQLGAYLNPAATVASSNGVVTGLNNALTGNLLNGSNWAPGQPWLGTIYGYDPSFENWSIQTTSSTGGTSLVTGLPTTALNANTGFETGLSPWVASFCAATQSSTQKHSGSFSAKIVPDGTDPVNDLASELITVVAGRQYTVTAWVWVTTAVTSKCDVAVGWFDSGNNSLGASTITAVSIPATTWTQVTGTFTAPATAALGQIHVQMQGTQPASNIFYIDDVSLTNVTAPTDGTAPVSVASFASTSDQAKWTPRFVPGQAYTFTVDVWAATGLSVKVGWFGITPASTTITGNNAYQTVSLTFTTATGDSAAPISYLYVQTPSAGSFPTTVYVANYTITGQSPGWTLTAGAAMHYTQVIAQAGQYSMSLVLNSAADSASLVMPTVPGQQYTFSSYVQIQNTGTGLTATQTIGSNTQTLSTASAWTRLSNTFTATTATTTVVWKSTTSAYPAKIYVDCVQLELAATASTFSLTGPVFTPLFTGWIERYPQQWSTQGRRGMRPLTGVDALSPLSRITPNTSYESVVLADNPTAYLALDDSALPQTVLLPQGGFAFRGYTSLGTSGQVSFQGDTFLDGTPCVSLTQQNANPPTSGNPAYVTYLGTTSGGVQLNPTGFTIECWVKFTSGTAYFGAASVAPGENPNGEALGPNQWIGWYTTAGQLLGEYSDANGQHFFSGLPGWSGYPDGQWHYLAIVLTGTQYHFYVDKTSGGFGTMTGTPLNLSVNNFFIDATTYFGDLSTVVAVSNMATYNYALTDAQLAKHYLRGSGNAGEADMARCLRMIDLYWSPATTIGTGEATMSADYYYFTNQVATISTSASTPPSLLQDLQDITATGDGFLWCDAYGIVHVDSRETRYTQASSASSQFTFSDNPTDIAAGALVYEDLAYDYDPTYVYSQAQLTVDGTNDVVTVTNSTSVTNYNQRILSKTMYMPDDWQVLQAANFYTQRYAAPAGAPGSSIPYRINKMTINPAANPALWQAALSLGVDDRITVTKKTAAGTIITGDYYIEQVTHNADVASGQWKVNYQLSPVWNPNPFIIGQSILGGGATWVY
jgi:hypothetical protein